MKCPECGNTIKFNVCIEAFADIVSEEGLSYFDSESEGNANIEYDTVHNCMCSKCDYIGVLEEFEEDVHKT